MSGRLLIAQTTWCLQSWDGGGGLLRMEARHLWSYLSRGTRGRKQCRDFYDSSHSQTTSLPPFSDSEKIDPTPSPSLTLLVPSSLTPLQGISPQWDLEIQRSLHISHFFLTITKMKNKKKPERSSLVSWHSLEMTADVYTIQENEKFHICLIIATRRRAWILSKRQWDIIN